METDDFVQRSQRRLLPLRQAPEKLLLGGIESGFEFREYVAQCQLPIHFSGVVDEYFRPVPDPDQNKCNTKQIETRGEKSAGCQKSSANDLDGALASSRRIFDPSPESGYVSFKNPDVIGKLAI